MVLTLSRSELAKELDVSIETVKKDALKKGFKEAFKTINNRQIKAYELTEAQLNELKMEKGVETPIETSFESSETYEDTSNNTDEALGNITTALDKILDFSKEHNERIETYIERALNAEMQTRLLTTSEANKDEELNRLNALVKELEMRIKTLESELEAERKRPFWKRNVL